MTTAAKEKGRIRSGGAGGFLNPPGHPEHSMSVETELRRRPENRGSMSLSYAVGEAAEWLDASTVAAAQRILDRWETEKLPLDHADVQEWIGQVLGYFRNCYRGDGEGKYGRGEWAAESLNIDADRDPLANVDDHAGVHLIRKYYPDYQPTADDFARARWGK